MQQNKRNIKLLIFIFFSILILLLVYFKFSSNKITINDNLRIMLVKAEKFLLNKKINSLSSIIPDSVITNRALCVMLYTGMDCGTCIEKGFETINQLSKEVHQKNIAIIASKSNIGRDQLMFNYHEYIYNDEIESIRQELRFIYTPVLILLDASKNIIKVYFPLTNESEEERENFLHLAIDFINNNHFSENILKEYVEFIYRKEFFLSI